MAPGPNTKLRRLTGSTHSNGNVNKKNFDSFARTASAFMDEGEGDLDLDLKPLYANALANAA